MLNRILQTIQKDGAVFFPPVDDRSLKFVSSLLASHRFPALPNDYITMLKMTDGFVWNGVEIYGTRANDRVNKGYTLPGVIEANLEYSQTPPMQGKLLLGRAAEELFVYDSLDQQYHIINRMDFSKSCTFNTFSEAIYLFVDELF
ncbi:MAG: YrhA family protein [Alphaproteobacteria bacterium]|nr:YrhA family protein [Alphaproteobacteria bacterium]